MPNAKLVSADLPTVPGAYQDNEGRIWLLESDPPSAKGKWRVPGGTIAKPGNRVLDAALEKLGVTELRKMIPKARRR